MTEIGKINKLIVNRGTEHGVYLEGDEEGEILLPNRYVPEDIKPGDEVEVFIYFDSEDRPVATTETPLAMVGDIARLKVVAVTKFGAFLDWGLPKDLLVPFREQKVKMEEGRSYFVKIYIDELSNRIAASAKIDNFLDDQKPELEERQEVDIVIYEQSDLGYKAIIEGKYYGMIFKNEVFQSISIGDEIKAYVKQIREDYKIDLSLQKIGVERTDEVSESILRILKEQGGYIAITGKSPAEKIYSLFGISKKVYKRTIGSLYKNKLITLEAEGFRLVE